MQLSAAGSGREGNKDGRGEAGVGGPLATTGTRVHELIRNRACAWLLMKSLVDATRSRTLGDGECIAQ